MTTEKDWMFRDSIFEGIWNKAKPFTMTSPARGYALYQAVRHVVEHKAYGPLVECGVWRGGSAMIMLLTLKALEISDRKVYLFDTFDGMTEASESDKDINGRSAHELMSNSNPYEQERAMVCAKSSEEEVRTNLLNCGYSSKLIKVVKGDIREVLSKTQTGAISLLRLGTDFYHSPKVAMEELYPRVCKMA
jgi:hypothetical protein